LCEDQCANTGDAVRAALQKQYGIRLFSDSTPAGEHARIIIAQGQQDGSQHVGTATEGRALAAAFVFANSGTLSVSARSQEDGIS
jgi:hypothetical protein